MYESKCKPHNDKSNSTFSVNVILSGFQYGQLSEYDELHVKFDSSMIVSIRRFEPRTRK